LINSRKFDEVSVLRILKSFLEGNLIELIWSGSANCPFANLIDT
jgi:hypothetical protein